MRKARSPAELAERLSCWQLALAQALKQANRASAAARRKRGRGASLGNAVVAGVEADTIGRLRDIFEPAGFLLQPPPAPSAQQAQQAADPSGAVPIISRVV